MLVFCFLAEGSINRILEGKKVSGATMQILGCKKIPGTLIDRYRLLISDGVTACPFAMLGTELNYLVTDKKLEKFTLVRVDRYVCNQVQPDRKVIILLNLTVLVPGAVVNEKLGNPKSYSTSLAAPAGNVTESNNESKSVFNAAPKTVSTPQVNGSAQARGEIMLPNLTAGSINRILEGEEVSGAVMQILGCKKIPDTVNNRYRVLISDGVTGCPFVMLGTQLNKLVTDKELEKFTLVRVDKCVCNEVQPDRKVIILLNLVVLVPGAEVNEKIGNPILSTSSAAPAGNVTENNNEF